MSSEPFMDEIGDLIDLERYPLERTDSQEWLALVERCRAAHREDGCVNLPGFVRADALADFAREASVLIERHGYRKSHLRTALFNQGDPSKPSGHPANHLFREKSLQIANDQIGDTLIRRIYEWQPLTDFVAGVEGCERLYRMADEFQALNLIAHETGNGLPWHFDVNNFTVTLLLQASEAGGEFVFVPGMRCGRDVDFVRMEQLFEGDGSFVHTTQRSSGTLTLFRGRNALHAVTPVEGHTSRITAVLTYDEKPDCVASERGNAFVYGPRVEAIYRERRERARIP